MTVGEKIQFYRKQKGLSQEELGKLLIVSRQTVSQWENGQTYPTVDNLMRLREVFGITMDDLVKEGEPALPEVVEEVPLETYQSKATSEEVDYLCCEHIKYSRRFLLPSRVTFILLGILFLLWGILDFLSFPEDSVNQLVFLVLFAPAWVCFIVVRWHKGNKETKTERLKMRAALEKDEETVIKVYEEHLVLSIRKEEMEYASQYVKFTDIEMVQETRDFYIAVHRPYIIYFRKKELVPDSILYAVFAKIIAERRKSEFTREQNVQYQWLTDGALLLVFLGITFFSLMIRVFELPQATYWIDAILLGGIFAQAVRFLLLAKKGYKNAKEYVRILLIAMLVFAGYRVIVGQWFPPATVVYSTDTEYIQRAEELADMDFPEEYFLTLESVNSQYEDEYIYWTALLEYWDVEEITRIVHEDSRWIDSHAWGMVTRVPGWEPGDEDIWDLFAVYNIDTDEWNTVPDDEETYHYIAFLWYQSGEMLLIIEYEK